VEFLDRVRTSLARRTRQTLDNPSLTCAAVLLPLLCKKGEWHVLVTQRSEQVEHHKGQISFPGGAREPGDADLLATALRETHEEIGVPPEMVEVLGALDDFQTVTSFVVTPFVGVIPHPFDYRPSKVEVDAVVEVPLSFLRDPAQLRVGQREYGGRLYDVLFWDYRPAHSQRAKCTYRIWGATAFMLKTFIDLAFLSDATDTLSAEQAAQ
jgi:8-oxo-dGTP pyrophosphatase MutT (NUDIX family)